MPLSRHSKENICSSKNEILTTKTGQRANEQLIFNTEFFYFL